MNKKIYTFKAKIDCEETGHNYPAVISKKGYDFSSSKSVHRIKHDEFPEFKPDFQFRLERGSKPCDILSQATISADGIIASKRLVDFLQTIDKSVPFKIYPFELETPNGKIIYYWVQFLWSDAINLVNFEETEFRISEFGEDKGQIEINSYKEYQEKQGEFGFTKIIYAKSIILKPINIDLFIVPFNGGLIVTKKIQTAIVKQAFLGVEILETDRVKLAKTF